jgi:hypothetical protein
MSGKVVQQLQRKSHCQRTSHKSERSRWSVGINSFFIQACRQYDNGWYCVWAESSTVAGELWRKGRMVTR